LSDNQMPDLHSLQEGLSPVRDSLNTIYLERNPGVSAPAPTLMHVQSMLMRMLMLMRMHLHTPACCVPSCYRVRR
jgi:hypothetical protein